MTVQELKKQVDKLARQGFRNAPLKINEQTVSLIFGNGWEFDRRAQEKRAYIDIQIGGNHESTR